LAVTVALAFRVNVHVFVLLLPLEHAPDQIASRPLLTLKVIEVLVAKLADAVLPTATLIPVGLDVTRSPLRPVAVTVNVAFADAGFTVNVAVRVTPAKTAEIVVAVEAVTVLVVIVKVAVVAPAATVTLPGTVADVLLLVSVTTVPPAGAALVSVTVPVDEFPPTTLVGLTLTADSDDGGGGGVTVSVAVRLTPLYVPVSVTLALAVTAVVLTVTVALVAPASTVTLAGTPATAGLLLESVTTAPPVGAAAVKVTVPVEELPPTTLVGFTNTEDRLAAAGAACGVKRRVAENGPNTPAEFCARTRHHKRCAGRPPIVICDTLTLWFAVNGAAMVEESST
jgi:hypothetical protein